MGPKAFVAACVVVLPLAACGTGRRDDDAAAVVEHFHAALESGGGRAACDLLGEATKSKLEQQEGKPCEQAILTLKIPKGGTTVVRHVEVTSAYVRLAEGSADFLSEGPGGWKISAAGCKPGASSDEPYECELEG